MVQKQNEQLLNEELIPYNNPELMSMQKEHHVFNNMCGANCEGIIKR